MKGRKGGYLCIADLTGTPLFVVALGEMPEEKRKQYLRNALEKAERLSYTVRHGGHYLSRQSRDESRERWGGAVAGKDFIYSFSGFPEEADEIFMVILAIASGSLESNWIYQALGGSNKYYAKAFDVVQHFA